jgi:branched-subunit amino acid aminotransferase/4-amino-4-deoxychorismate lyase
MSPWRAPRCRAPIRIPWLATPGGHAARLRRGLLLDVDGFVAEGAGENIFIVKDGVIYEPELTSALTGITRSSVIELAEGSATR